MTGCLNKKNSDSCCVTNFKQREEANRDKTPQRQSSTFGQSLDLDVRHFFDFDQCLFHPIRHFATFSVAYEQQQKYEHIESV